MIVLTNISSVLLILIKIVLMPFNIKPHL